MECRDRSRGFTIVEVAVVMVIFLGAAALIYQVARSLSVSYRTGETKIQVEENLRTGMTAAIGELRQAQRASLQVQQGGAVAYPTGDSVTFRIPEDRDGNGNVLDDLTGMVEYSLPITLKRNAEGHLVREQDLNGNFVWGDTPGEVRILAINVASVEFFLTEPPGAGSNTDVVVTLTVERNLGEDVIRRTLQETALPRN